MRRGGASASGAAPDAAATPDARALGDQTGDSKGQNMAAPQSKAYSSAFAAAASAPPGAEPTAMRSAPAAAHGSPTVPASLEAAAARLLAEGAGSPRRRRGHGGKAVPMTPAPSLSDPAREPSGRGPGEDLDTAPSSGPVPASAGAGAAADKAGAPWEGAEGASSPPPARTHSGGGGGDSCGSRSQGQSSSSSSSSSGASSSASGTPGVAPRNPSAPPTRTPAPTGRAGRRVPEASGLAEPPPTPASRTSSQDAGSRLLPLAQSVPGTPPPTPLPLSAAPSLGAAACLPGDKPASTVGPGGVASATMSAALAPLRAPLRAGSGGSTGACAVRDGGGVSREQLATAMHDLAAAARLEAAATSSSGSTPAPQKEVAASREGRANGLGEEAPGDATADDDGVLTHHRSLQASSSRNSTATAIASAGPAADAANGAAALPPVRGAMPGPGPGPGPGPAPVRTRPASSTGSGSSAFAEAFGGPRGGVGMDEMALIAASTPRASSLSRASSAASSLGTAAGAAVEDALGLSGFCALGAVAEGVGDAAEVDGRGAWESSSSTSSASSNGGGGGCGGGGGGGGGGGSGGSGDGGGTNSGAVRAVGGEGGLVSGGAGNNGGGICSNREVRGLPADWPWCAAALRGESHCQHVIVQLSALPFEQ
jgi:hypothetical protein